MVRPISTSKSARCHREARHFCCACQRQADGEAADAGFADRQDFDLSRNLAGLIGSGLERNIVPMPTASGP